MRLYCKSVFTGSLSLLLKKWRNRGIPNFYRVARDLLSSFLNKGFQTQAFQEERRSHTSQGLLSSLEEVRRYSTVFDPLDKMLVHESCSENLLLNLRDKLPTIS